MGHSQEEKATSRAKIVAAAAKRIRNAGLSGFSIADVMQDADLTHGGFYGHFSSRDELIAAALSEALHESEVVHGSCAQLSLKQIVTRYLSRGHRDNTGDGCAVVALGSEIPRAAAETRAVMDTHLQQYIRTITATLDDNSDPALAIPIVCMLNGALNLSRLVDDKSLSDKILKTTRDYILTIATDPCATAAPTRKAARG